MYILKKFINEFKIFINRGNILDLAVAAVDYANLAAIVVTGLVAETEYYVEFTIDDGLTQSTVIITIATP